MLHRVQAPESPSTPARLNTEQTRNADGGAGVTPGPNDAETAGSPLSRLESLQNEINRHPHLRCEWATSELTIFHDANNGLWHTSYRVDIDAVLHLSDVHWCLAASRASAAGDPLFILDPPDMEEC
jgi:hypothetical protein